MQRYIQVGSTILAFLLLIGCAANRNPYPGAEVARENWQQQVETNPTRWTHGADTWFLTGEPNATEIANRQAPPAAAITTMSVRAPEFNGVQVNGAFQVQIFGTTNQNTVYLYGPNVAIREIAVSMRHNTLYVNQLQYVPNMKEVIVRIGMKTLKSLTQAGCGKIEAIQISSTDLCVAAMPHACGDIYLSGKVNLTRVIHAGSGGINIFGANTSLLDINASGTGAVNIIGNVGVRSITHRGAGNINIIGGNSNGLKIDACGSGKIGINGLVNIKQIIAGNTARVYAFPVTSTSIKVYAYDQAHIGLAGTTADLSVETFKMAQFAGRYLCTQNAFARAHDTSHINVAATNKIFASATGRSSIYFFGAPSIMTQFASNNSTILPLWNSGLNACSIIYRPVARTYTAQIYR